MNPLKRFFSTYYRVLKLAYQIHPGFLILLSITNLAWGLTNLPVIYINRALIDLVVSNIGNPNWASIAKTIVVLVSVRTLIDMFRSFLGKVNYHIAGSLGSLMSDRITIILGSKLNSLDIPTVESADFQDKYAKISQQSHNRMWGMVSTLQEIPNALATIASGVIPIFQFNPLLVLAVIISVIPDALVSPKLARIGYEEREKRNRLYRVLGWLNWIITDTRQFYENKISANVKYVSEKMMGLQKNIFDNDLRMRNQRILWRTADELPQWIAALALNAYFFILALVGRVTIGTAQLLYQSSQTLANGFGMLMNNVASIYENYLFVDDYTQFMDLKPQNSSGKKIFPTKITKGIEFKDVWFKYPNSNTWTLRGINFKIGPGENIALVGENGAGKTTLLKLLLGFYKQQKGRIVIDGTPILDYNLTRYWKQLSILPQEYHLYPFSARESISFSDLSRSKDLESIKQAARLAQIHSYIHNLPQKYDTPLSKDLDGIDPSGGQKQRIAIARTIFKKSQIMILDEPTSSVDPKAEEDIFENVLRITKDQIVILVSHRFSTVRKADKIFLLERGQILEHGSHKELMKQEGKYASLFELQAKSYQ